VSLSPNLKLRAQRSPPKTVFNIRVNTNTFLGTVEKEIRLTYILSSSARTQESTQMK